MGSRSVFMAFVAMVVLSGCASIGHLPGNVRATDEGKVAVAAGKWDDNAAAQIVFGVIDPTTGKRGDLKASAATVVLQTAVTCQEDMDVALAGPFQSTVMGAATTGILGAGATAIMYDLAYNQQILRNKSNVALGATIGGVLNGVFGGYDGYVRGSYAMATAISECVKQVSAQNPGRPKGMYIVGSPNGKAGGDTRPSALKGGEREMMSLSQ